MSDKIESNMKRLGRLIKEAYGEVPTSVEFYDNIKFCRYREKLARLVKGMLIVECDSLIPINYVKEALVERGYFAMTDTSFGVIPLVGSMGGEENVFKRPMTFIAENNFLGSLERSIGDNCILYYLYSDKYPISPYTIIDDYAKQLALADTAIEVNLLNTRVVHVFSGVGKKALDTAKRVYEKIAKGEPAVFFEEDKNIEGGSFTSSFAPVKQAYIVDMVQDAKRTIMNEFLSEFGINNANTDKRERLNTKEVDANNEELELSRAVIEDNLTECNKRYIEMFGKKRPFKVSLRYNKETETGVEDIVKDN